MFHERIVVGTDFSEPSMHAVSLAAAWGERLALPITMVHAYGPAPIGPGGMVPAPMWAGVPNSSRHLAERAEQKLAEMGKTVLAGARHDAVVVEHLSAAIAICDAAEARSADLVVVGTHGKTGLDRLLLGSVAEQVVRHAPCSVLVARSGAGNRGLPTHLLVCTDFSPAAEPALAVAADVARAFDAEVSLMHVLSHGSWHELADEMTPGAMDDIVRRTRESMAASHAARFPRAPFTHVAVAADVPGAIVEHAAEASTDLVVIGTHGRTGIPRLLLGSVAERVVRRAGCSVLVARPPSA